MSEFIFLYGMGNSEPQYSTTRERIYDIRSLFEEERKTDECQKNRAKKKKILKFNNGGCLKTSINIYKGKIFNP